MTSKTKQIKKIPISVFFNKDQIPNKYKTIKAAKKYLLDELQAGRIIKYFSMKNNRFYF